MNPYKNDLEIFSHENPVIDLAIESLSEKVMKGMIIWDRSVINTIQETIKKIDQLISKQISIILHNNKFSQLEGSWRGIHQLVKSKSKNNSKIKLLHLNKLALSDDIAQSCSFDQSELYKKIYDQEFASPGGEPYSILIGDYEFMHLQNDIQLLSNISKISAAAFCPFISAASAEVFGLSSWTEINKPKDLNNRMEGNEHIPWKQLREQEDSRFLYLTLPRTLARLPYTFDGIKSGLLNIDEFIDLSNSNTQSDSYQFCWMNSAYLLAKKMLQAFTQYGWCTAIRGAEGGGKIENLPFYTISNLSNPYSDSEYQCPTEVNITDRRESELSQLGFLPLCHYKNTDYAVFFGAESLQKPKRYDQNEFTENAAISSRLPYIMATSRFAQYLKIMARDKVGAFMNASEAEDWLNRWILNYVNGNAQSKQELKAKYPLAEAKIKVIDVPGNASSYQVIAWLRPWLQMEQLSTSMRLVTEIPKSNN